MRQSQLIRADRTVGDPLQRQASLFGRRDQAGVSDLFGSDPIRDLFVARPCWLFHDHEGNQVGVVGESDVDPRAKTRDGRSSIGTWQGTNRPAAKNVAAELPVPSPTSIRPDCE